MAEVLLARAGIFERAQHESLSEKHICSSHIESAGKNWLDQSVNCKVPKPSSSHPDRTHKADRVLGKRHAEAVYYKTGELLPVGLRICPGCAKQLMEWWLERKDKMQKVRVLQIW